MYELTENQRFALRKKCEIVDMVKEGVCIYFGLDPNQNLKKNKLTANVRAKQFIVYILKVLAPTISTSFIGERLGGFDHATILHTMRTTQNLMDTDGQYKSQIFEVLNIFLSEAETNNALQKILADNYFYVNLNKIKVIKASKESAIVFAGISDSVIQEIKAKYFNKDNTVVLNLNNTGVAIMGKKKKLLQK